MLLYFLKNNFYFQSEPEQLGASQKDKQPELRSQSFREQTGSPRLERSDRQNSLPPPDSSLLNAAACGSPSAGGGSTAEPGAAGGDSEPTSPGSGGSTPLSSTGSGPKKRLQRVEILKIVDSPPMIEPSQVVVNKAQVLVADPIVTPFEMLREKVRYVLPLMR